jgi:thioredoxin reductase
MPNEVLDVPSIGGRPTGLFGAFYPGVRGTSAGIIDSLPELGGQFMALYPEKDVFDVGGIPKILAKDLAKDMVTQGLQFGAEAILDEESGELTREGDHFILKGRNGDYTSRSGVVAGGKGAFEPMHLKAPGYQELLGKGIHYAVKEPEDYRGKRVLLVSSPGGSSSTRIGSSFRS